MYAKVSDKTVVEELAGLRKEVSDALLSEECVQLISDNKILPITDVENMQVSKIKGWLFNFYSLAENHEKYDKINDRTLEYRNNIREAASVEDIALWNSMVLDWRNEECY